MDKEQLTRILSRAPGAAVKTLANLISEKYPVSLLREPMKTLVMLPMNDPVNFTPFYLGELLASEAMVEINGVKGFGICMGDDYDRSMSIAILDAAFNAGLAECGWIEERIAALERIQKEASGKISAKHQDTQVSFETMEGH